jgi:hypothetical protein
VFRSASSGQRIEITAAENDMIRFYSGGSDEGTSARILASSTTNNPYLAIWGPTHTGGGNDLNSIYLNSEGYSTYGVDVTSIYQKIRFDSRGNGAGGSGQIEFLIGGTDKVFLTATGLEQQTTGAPHIRFTGAGSASTPTYSFYGDENTGIYGGGSGTISISCDGTNAITFDILSTDRPSIQFDSGDYLQFDRSDNYYYFNVGSSVKTTIADNGRVGVGDTSPDAGFDHTGTGQSAQFYRNTSTSTAVIIEGRSSVGGTNLQKWIVEADGDTRSATGTYSTISDERLKVKTSLKPAKDYSDDLRSFAPIKYRLKGVTETYLGYSAQQVERHKPGLVKTSPYKTYKMTRDGEYAKDQDGQRIVTVDEVKGVKTSLLIPMLHSGWLAHDKRLAALEAHCGL